MCLLKRVSSSFLKPFFDIWISTQTTEQTKSESIQFLVVDEAETRIKKLKSKTHSRNFASNHRGDWVPIFCFSLVTAIETDVDIHFVEAIANQIKFFLNNLVGSGNESNDQWSFYKVKATGWGVLRVFYCLFSPWWSPWFNQIWRHSYHSLVAHWFTINLPWDHLPTFAVNFVLSAKWLELDGAD